MGKRCAGVRGSRESRKFEVYAEVYAGKVAEKSDTQRHEYPSSDMTPQERTDFLASFGNAFELDDDTLRQPWCSTEGLPVVVQKQSIQEYREKSVMPVSVKQNVTKSFSWAGPRRPMTSIADAEMSKKYSNDTEHYSNDVEQFKERLSYLMPYSHKHGPDDVIPSIGSLRDRNRCQSMPFITPVVKQQMMLERQCRIFDDDDGEGEEEGDHDGDMGDKDTSLSENVVQSSLVGSDGGDEDKKGLRSFSTPSMQ